MKKILLVCTGNSCRSQMAEAILRKLDPELEVMSAGTDPEIRLTKETIEVMSEDGYDLEGQYPKDVFDHNEKSFDYLITLCNNAKKNLPKFSGKIGKRLHLEFVDPASVKGSKEKVLEEYREVRDEIKKAIVHFYETKLCKSEAVS